MSARKAETVEVRMCPTCGREWNGKITLIELAEAIDDAWDLLRTKLRTVFGSEP